MIAGLSNFAPVEPAASAASGPASGGVRAVLRLEGAAAFAAAVALYGHAGFSWPLFALLFLAPDLAMLAYLIGPRAGALVYNLAHTYALALPLALAGFILAQPSPPRWGSSGSPTSASTACSATGSNIEAGSATRTSAASAGVEPSLE